MIFTLIHSDLQKQTDSSIFVLDPAERVSKTDSSGYVPIDKMVARFRKAGEQLNIFRAASAPSDMPDLNPLFTNSALEDRLAGIDEARVRTQKAREDYEMARKEALKARKKAREDHILILAKKIAKVRDKEVPSEEPSSESPE